MNTWIRLAWISGAVVIIDQITKYLIKTQVVLHDQIAVIKGLFNITYIMNPGGAFGFFAAGPAGVRKFIFLFLSSMVALFVVWFYHRTRNFLWLSSGLALIFGGAVGNLIDRFAYGEVIDFLDFHIGTAHWPAFNVADSAICVGMCVLIYHILLNKVPDL